MLRFKWLLIFFLGLLLAGCYSGTRYREFYTHTDILRQALQKCGNSTSDYCMDAHAAAQSLALFSALSASQRSLFMKAQSAGSVNQLSLVDRQALMFAETSIQVKFGQKIAEAQVALRVFEQQLDQAPGSQKRALRMKVAYQKKLIDAMRALVLLNNPE